MEEVRTLCERAMGRTRQGTWISEGFMLVPSTLDDILPLGPLHRRHAHRCLIIELDITPVPIVLTPATIHTIAPSDLFHIKHTSSPWTFLRHVADTLL